MMSRSYETDFELSLGARNNFEILANALSSLDSTSTKEHGEFECSIAGGKLPCALTLIPRNEEGCQLTQRIELLYKAVRPKCSPEFAEKYDEVLENLVKMSRPATRNCPAPGETMDRAESGRMAKLFEQEFGQSFMQMSKVHYDGSLGLTLIIVFPLIRPQ